MAFTHLHVHTEFSLLDGSNKIKEYVKCVKELGMDSAAITDHGVMYGCIDFYKAARAQGINTSFNKVLGFALANTLVALSGAMLCQYNGFAEINMGRGAIVIGLAAIIISNVIFGKLFTNFAAKLLAVVIGAVLYYVVIQVVLWLGLDTNLLKLLSALIVAVFLAVPYWKANMKGGGRRA